MDEKLFYFLISILIFKIIMKRLNFKGLIMLSLISVNLLAAEKQPNILFVLADDQRANTINYLGNDEIITPNLDKLVQEGTYFNNTYIMGSYSGAVCQPSRAMLLTGRYLNNLKKTGGFIPETDITVGETLQKAGYNCYGIGKYHSDQASFARCFNDGTDIYFGGMFDQWNVPLNSYESLANYKRDMHPVIEDAHHSNKVTYTKGEYTFGGKHSTEIFSEAAIDYIASYNSEKPFFLYTALMTPHDPRSTYQSYIDMYDTANISIPENFLPEHPFDNGELRVRDEQLAAFPRVKSEVKEHIRDYYALITQNDAKLGQIIQALKDKGIYDNTIIIYSGDNGLGLGQHGLMGKQNMYDHSAKVPLLMVGDGITANQKSDALVYLSDLYPTICEMVGVEIPASVQTSSFYASVKDAEAPHREFLMTSYKAQQRGVRDGQYKMIKYNVKGEKHLQLFDLANDPWETTNLIENKKYKREVKTLEAAMDVMLVEFNDDKWTWE